MISHHLDDDLLVSYAAGTLSEGWSIGVATHLALCPACRKRLASLEAVGGHFFEASDASADTGQSWNDMKRRLAASRHEPESQPRQAEPHVLPEPLRSYVAGKDGTLKWRALGRGAAQIKVATGDPTTMVRLLKIPAGQPVPEHGHGGLELTLVLDGAFMDGETVFARGDVELADGDLEHQPIATPGKDCICLAVTDAPLRFKSRFMRILQPILGI